MKVHCRNIPLKVSDGLVSLLSAHGNYLLNDNILKTGKKRNRN